jgi:hypothetical protein
MGKEEEEEEEGAHGDDTAIVSVEFMKERETSAICTPSFSCTALFYRNVGTVPTAQYDLSQAGVYKHPNVDVQTTRDTVE